MWGKLVGKGEDGAMRECFASGVFSAGLGMLALACLGLLVQTSVQRLPYF